MKRSCRECGKLRRNVLPVVEKHTHSKVQSDGVTTWLWFAKDLEHVCTACWTGLDYAAYLDQPGLPPLRAVH